MCRIFGYEPVVATRLSLYLSHSALLPYHPTYTFYPRAAFQLFSLCLFPSLCLPPPPPLSYLPMHLRDYPHPYSWLLNLTLGLTQPGGALIPRRRRHGWGGVYISPPRHPSSRGRWSPKDNDLASAAANRSNGSGFPDSSITNIFHSSLVSFLPTLLAPQPSFPYPHHSPSPVPL